MPKKNNETELALNQRKISIKSIFEIKELTILLIVVVFAIFLSFATPHFLRTSNLLIIVNGLALNMIIAVGLTVSLIGGNTDFSVGSMMGCCAFITGKLLVAGTNIALSIVGGLCVGIILGMINGILVVKLKVLPIVVTMGTWMAYKGLGLALVGNASLSNLPAGFKVLAQEWTFFGLPFNIGVMIIIMVIGSFLLKYSRFFHEAFFIGGNKESARLAGINVNLFTVITYSITGMLCAISGILMLSRLGSAPATLGQGVEFNIISALLIGGVSFNGGQGSIMGAFLGILLMGIISNALALFGINANLQLVIVGTILVFSVWMDEVNRRRKERM
ncbi:MAG TPA: ABC transporter permease [Clostridia bacterium]|nr:ABC transporter permease [Clostridia bacterium]